MFRSATFKLTLWYLAIVMMISLIFSVVLYHFATAELARGLHHETQRIYTQFPVFNNNPLLRPNDDIVSGSHRILLRLIAFNIVVLVGSGVASYFLARRTLQPIEDAHEQQKRFTADVSHELRTPLTAIRMESEVALLGSGATAQDLRAVITSNLEEVSKLELLINNLLRLTRLEADEIRHTFSTVRLIDVVTSAIEQVNPIAAARNITIQSSVKDGETDGDATSLIQALVILLDNAIKYSPANSTIEVSSKLANGQIEVSITDHGGGISKQALEHVFDRFYRADDSRKKDSGEHAGYGLGLSIAKMIADVHQANITLTSRLGKGTTARLILKPRDTTKVALPPIKND